MEVIGDAEPQDPPGFVLKLLKCRHERAPLHSLSHEVALIESIGRLSQLVGFAGFTHGTKPILQTESI